jgi:hypothetical protein
LKISQLTDGGMSPTYDSVHYVVFNGRGHVRLYRL